MDKFQSASNQTQKEKFEADLKKEIKKLQRLRDQIKTWLTNNEIKDKRTLLEARKDIESDMERFKVIEKETKTKMYSKEGLCMEQKRDPRDKEKEEMEEWLRSKINILSEHIEKFEYDIESLVNAMKRKRGNDKEKQEAIEGKRTHLEHHKWHITKLEACMRLLNNDRLDLDVLKNVKDSVSYYIDEHEDPDFMDDELIYDELHLDDVADMSVVGALAEHNDSLREGADSQDDEKEDNNAGSGDNPPNATSSRSSSPPQSMSSRVSAEDRSLASSTNSFEPRERHKSENEPPSTPLKLPGLPTAPLRGHNSSQSSAVPTSLPDMSKTNDPPNSASQPTAILASPSQPVPPQPPQPSEQPSSSSGPPAQQQTPRALAGRLHTPNFPQLHIPAASSGKSEGTETCLSQKLDTEEGVKGTEESSLFSGVGTIGLTPDSNIPQPGIDDQNQQQLSQHMHLSNQQSGLLPLQQVSLMQQQQQSQSQQQSTQPQQPQQSQQQQPQAPQPPPSQQQSIPLPVQSQEQQLQLQIAQSQQPQQTQASMMPINLVSGNVPFSGVAPISIAQAQQSQSTASIGGLTSPSILHRGTEPSLSEPMRRQAIIGEGGQSTPNHLKVMAQQAIRHQQQLQLQQQQKQSAASQLLSGPQSQQQAQQQQSKSAPQQQGGNIQGPPGVHRFAPGMPGVPSSFLQTHMQQQLKTSGAGNIATPPQALVNLAGRQADGGPDSFHLFDAYGPIGPSGPPSNVNPMAARMMASPSQRLTQKLTQHTQLLENALKKVPVPTDSERLRYHLARAPSHAITPNYYPQTPRPQFTSEDYYMKLDVQTLFFIFYYFEGTKAQYLAAKTLKKMSWRFHSQQLYWFQRHEEPKTIGPEFEQGAYIYFDFEQFKQKRKENFKFEYKYLEDIEM